MSRDVPPDKEVMGQGTVFWFIQKPLLWIQISTRLVMVGGSDENNRSISRYVEGASGSNLSKEHTSDHLPKQHSSLVGQF